MTLETRPEFDISLQVKEETESLHEDQGSTSMHGPTRPANFESRSLKLRISNVIPEMWTGNLITGIGGTPVTVTLVDSRTNEEVKSGPEASGKVEIVVIGAEADSVTRHDLEKILVPPHMEGSKSRCVSKLCLNLIEGSAVLPMVSFLHNKTWRKKSNIRLQARFVEHFSGIEVEEAQTEPFVLKDRRNEVYKKHPVPSKHNARSNKVGKSSSLIFDASKQAKNLEITTKHAQKSPAKLKQMNKSRINRKRGNLVKISKSARSEFAKYLVISESTNWENVITINDNQSSTHLHNKSEFLNGSDLIIDESSLFDTNMLSAGQNPNPEFLPESLRTRYNEIYHGFESLCTSNQYQPGPSSVLVHSKVSQVNRFCKRWRMLFCVVTFTIGSLMKKCAKGSHVHKKRKLS
uniref:calmodulin-binding protein 60 F-like isoform X2 n=1 Tax=Erigeron canadensis TaxID=72917 RepID=UPI001CB9B037|nr:calmodulin-binding protein 60 F-like isoform X2 [Erigeron canadensis]